MAEIPRGDGTGPTAGAAALPAIPIAGPTMPCLAFGCSVCCHDTEMLLTEADVQRIGDVARGVDFWFQAEDGYLQLKTRSGPAARGAPHPGAAPCTFLDDDGMCSIHDVRPEGCRIYPGAWDDEARRAVLDAEHCPHTDGFVLDGAASTAAARLAARLHAERDARMARASGHRPLGWRG